MGADKQREANRKADFANIYKEAELFIHNPNTTIAEVMAFVQKHPHALSNGRNSCIRVFRGQTLAHWYVNQKRFDIVAALQQKGDRLNTPSTSSDKKDTCTGSTALLALCMQNPTPETIEQQLQITQTALKQDWKTATIRRSDGMTPMLAAACRFNYRLMQVIHTHYYKAYTDSTSRDNVATIMTHDRTNEHTAPCLTQAIRAHPSLFNATLIARLLTGRKQSVLQELFQEFGKPTDIDIIQAWNERLYYSPIYHDMQDDMYQYLSSEYPHLPFTASPFNIVVGRIQQQPLQTYAPTNQYDPNVRNTTLPIEQSAHTYKHNPYATSESNARSNSTLNPSQQLVPIPTYAATQQRYDLAPQPNAMHTHQPPAYHQFHQAPANHQHSQSSFVTHANTSQKIPRNRQQHRQQHRQKQEQVVHQTEQSNTYASNRSDW